ncbi:HAMP domain-containing sensor histidine kinase [Paenibacillus humicola]|uniref:HAMP domain-containing sensor histidine kinase n=1 Tax=Paenibacillus humicola TaxID=3110540 RepID=UPI00237B4FBD|nr:HAMP domain-containing histidine kinase [Paenibacillus humicola]
MTNLLKPLNALPLKWRLAAWSSVLILFLIVVYNGVQYLVIDRWALGQEKRQLQKELEEIQGFYADPGAPGLAQSRGFLGKMNDSHQMIRILNDAGVPELTVSNRLPADWVKPQQAAEPEMTSQWHGDDHLLILRSPFRAKAFAGTIEMAQNLEKYESLTHLLFLVMGFGGLFGIALGAGGSVMLAGQFVKPIRQLAGTMGRIRQNGLSERVEIGGTRDELSRLSQVFNEMMDRLERSFMQQKQFVEDASHELRTPIAIVEGHLAMLNRWGKHRPEILDESLQASLRELARLKDLTQELLALSKAEAPAAGEERSALLSDPFCVVRRMVADFGSLHPEFTFEQELPPNDAGYLVGFTEDHWQQTLLILLDNAVKYSGDNRRVRIRGSIAGDGGMELEVADYGIGIPQRDLERVFERFYRVDKARSRDQGGSGLGLAIAKRLVERYSGSISAASEENKGTTIKISLPSGAKR